MPDRGTPQVPIKRKRRRAVRALLLTPAVLLSLLLLGIFLLLAFNWGDHQVSRKLLEENFKPGTSKEEIWEILPSNALILIMPRDDPFNSEFERVADVDTSRLRASTGWVLNQAGLASFFFRREAYTLYFENDRLESVLIETKFGLDEHGHQGFSDSSEGGAEP